MESFKSPSHPLQKLQAIYDEEKTSLESVTSKPVDKEIWQNVKEEQRVLFDKLQDKMGSGDSQEESQKAPNQSQEEQPTLSKKGENLPAGQDTGKDSQGDGKALQFEEWNEYIQ